MTSLSCESGIKTSEPQRGLALALPSIWLVTCRIVGTLIGWTGRSDKSLAPGCLRWGRLPLPLNDEIHWGRWLVSRSRRGSGIGMGVVISPDHTKTKKPRQQATHNIILSCLNGSWSSLTLTLLNWHGMSVCPGNLLEEDLPMVAINVLERPEICFTLNLNSPTAQKKRTHQGASRYGFATLSRNHLNHCHVVTRGSAGGASGNPIWHMLLEWTSILLLQGDGMSILLVLEPCLLPCSPKAQWPQGIGWKGHCRGPSGPVYLHHASCVPRWEKGLPPSQIRPEPCVPLYPVVWVLCLGWLVWAIPKYASTGAGLQTADFIFVDAENLVWQW